MAKNLWNYDWNNFQFHDFMVSNLSIKYNIKQCDLGISTLEIDMSALHGNLFPCISSASSRAESPSETRITQLGFPQENIRVEAVDICRFNRGIYKFIQT